MKILIVDNQAQEAQFLATALQQGGFSDTHFAKDSNDAIEHINALGGIDVLVTDIFLEPKDGLSLRELLLPHLPHLQTIFLTAYDISAYADRIGSIPVLPKPVNSATLFTTLQSLLSPPVATPVAAPKAVPAPVATPTPVAAPKAVPAPVATPTPVAAPKAVPAPIATPTPVAAPKAVPAPVATPTPVAAPKAVPAPIATPTPVATPKAVPAPVATPTPVAAPKAVPAPVATPVAAPKAVPAPVATPTPVAAPKAVPAPVATPTPVAAPKAVPAPVATSTPVATPKATPTPAAVPTPVATPKATPQPTPVTQSGSSSKRVRASGENDLSGSTIGLYVIEEKIGQSLTGGIYRAHQTNIDRKVEFHALDAELAAKHPSAVKEFLADASKKANVSHPYILAVYEAGESGGTYFYTSEYFGNSHSLEQIMQLGQTLDEKTALRTLKITSEVLFHLSQNKTQREMISAGAILIGATGQIRIRNLALHLAAEDFQPITEIDRLATILFNALDPSIKSGSLAKLLQKMGKPQGIHSWGAALQEIQALEPKVIPKEEAKITARERAAILAVEESKKRQKRSMLVSTISTLSLLLLTLIVVYWAFFKRTAVKNFDTMIEVPAGEFIYQDGKKINLPAFWISQYEVTVGQYAQFLEYLTKHPEEAQKFDHPDQPKGKSHIPAMWADDKNFTPPNPGYYQRAVRWKKFDGADYDVNSPVMNVDWWDAYAYAKWKGQELPTEEQWEKAARGTKGLKYPWGDTLDEKKVNSGADYTPNPDAKGTIDGWKAWSPVDAVVGDKSPYGVMGMGGNVSEWTSTWVDGEDRASGFKTPVIRGGHFREREPDITKRVYRFLPEFYDTALGFRTVSSTPPTK